MRPISATLNSREGWIQLKSGRNQSCLLTHKKVISGKKWFVAGTSDGVIHVYNYDNRIQKLRSFRAASDCFITSMAVNPTRSYVLSSAYHDIKLWDWSKGWECTKSFVQEHTDTVSQVAFNPMDTNILCFR
uniref:Anaphase-promoting complex subunit 4 WD40 domain-containing protein n=1 Tax=Aegilops tauschii subsp. strangulata TaxID=200361 RepID=A0A453RNV1_AEGTS